MSDRYIRNIEYNIKGGGAVELGQRTLLVGPNGAGKSAVVNAVEACLTGKVSDIAGRKVVASGTELLSLGNAEGSWAEGRLDDGEATSWQVKRTSDGRAKKAVRKGAEGVLPLREVLDALTGSPDKARRYLMRHACVAVDENQILGRMDPAALTRYQRLTDESLSAADNLLAVCDLAAERKRNTRKEKDAAAKTIDAAALGLGQKPQGGAVDAAKEARNRAEAVVAEALRLVATAEAASLQASQEDNTFQIDALRDALGRSEADQRLLEEAIASLPTRSPQAEALLLVIQSMSEHPHEDCFACGQSRPDGWDAHRASLERALSQGHTTARRAELERELAGGRSQITNARARLQGLEELMRRRQSEKVVSPISLAEATERLEAARAADDQATHAWEDAVSRREAWKGVEVAQETRRNAETEERGWEYLHEVCSSLVEELVEKAVETFTARVQRFLPADDTFGLKLSRNAVRYGLVKDERLYTALSGAEWARVSLALAAVCTPEDAGVTVLVPEDRAWDPKTLKGVLKGLSDYDGQVIVTTTVKPYRGVPAGWTMVEVGA